MNLQKFSSPGHLDEKKIQLREFWEGVTNTVYSAYSPDHQYRQLDNTSEMIREAVINISEGEKLPGLNIPRFTVDFGTTSTASFWGGRQFRASSGNPWIEPVIHCPEDISLLNAVPPEKGHTAQSLELYEKFCKAAGTNNIPCTTYDIQGPLNTLALMWEQQDFMMAMYDSPHIVHEALDMVTGHLTGQIKAQYSQNPMIEAPLWPYIWLPRDIGIGITEDYMPLLSPDLYKEFGIPYVKRLSDEFGGLFIHCCGMFSHQIDNLAESRINIIGMEFVYPNADIEKLFSAFGDSAVFVPNIMDKYLEDFGGLAAYFEHIEKLRKKDTRIWYLLRPELDDFDEQVALMKKVAGEIH